MDLGCSSETLTLRVIRVESRVFAAVSAGVIWLGSTQKSWCKMIGRLLYRGLLRSALHRQSVWPGTTMMPRSPSPADWPLHIAPGSSCLGLDVVMVKLRVCTNTTITASTRLRAF